MDLTIDADGTRNHMQYLIDKSLTGNPLWHRNFYVFGEEFKYKKKNKECSDYISRFRDLQLVLKYSPLEEFSDSWFITISAFNFGRWKESKLLENLTWMEKRSYAIVLQEFVCPIKKEAD